MILWSGDDCSEFSGDLRSLGFYDTFPYEEHAESKTRLSPHWSRIIGGQLMPNYCDGYTDGVVFFGSRGPRSLQTKEMDSRSLRYILSVGSIYTIEKISIKKMFYLNQL